MSISFADSLVRNHGLPQGKTTVVCRNLGMQENPKAATPQLYHRPTQKVQVLEAAAAQANPVHSIGRANLAAHFADRCA
jgi:coenzyme F420-reducing hydrogenase beta subunit